MTSLSKSSLSSSSSRKVSQSGSSGNAGNRHELAATGNALPELRVDKVSPKHETGDSLDQAVKNAGHYAEKSGRNLEFSIEHKSKSTVVTVRDGETGEIVRQIPMEEMLALARLLADVQGPGDDSVLKGVFFDQDT